MGVHLFSVTLILINVSSFSYPYNLFSLDYVNLVIFLVVDGYWAYLLLFTCNLVNLKYYYADLDMI